ncbi:MAG: methylated-DNA--[protein]-cysteine S-methyltransferase [Syntrophus sp. (in: bacteria)]|nr:methylated-DNA--[protein]-cysteine S-methyltransferase [Syntrophus sp. (in: bacteria)]
MVAFILEDSAEDVNLDLIEYTFFESQTDIISVVSKNGSIISLDIRPENTYEAKKRLSTLYPEGRQSDKPFRKIQLLLDRYLKGRKVEFDIDIDISGESPFTQKVLLELRKIPYGQLRSYLSIGKQLGYAMAARAVGQAVKRNPIPIIIPCHRVIREDGSLGGFSLGIEIKKRLLVLEDVFDNIKNTGFIKA